MFSKKRNYVIIGAMGGYISGAPIYYRNKALYMRSQGWNVYCVSCRGGKVYVDGLEQFIICTIPLVTQKPYLLSESQQQKVIREIVSCIPGVELETVIETGTFYTAYWGEMLAKELKARHTVIYLDEHNFGINKQQAGFFKFKYDRNELACISDEAYKDIFSSFWKYEKAHSYTLPCYCTNSLEDISSSMIQKVKKADYTIGYIGRLEKDAFNVLLDGLCKFAKQYPDNSFALNCFGGYDSESGEVLLRKRLEKYPNIKLYISGFLFPIPKKAITKCALCFASAGSVAVPVKANVPTISMNVYTNLPNGFRVDPNNRLLHISCPHCSSVVDYLKAFFIDGFRPRMHEYDLDEDKLLFEKYLGKHLVFMEQSKKNPLCYYEVEHLDMTLNERVKMILFIILKVLGIRYGGATYLKIHKLFVTSC